MSDVDKIDEGTGGLGSLSRRDFIFREGAALGAVALGSTAFGLTGCAPEVTSDPEQSSGDAGSTAVEEELPGAQPIPPEEPPATWDKEADIVVVGTGTGGVIAAAYAADAGNSVITVEKLATPGGSSQHSAVFICPGGSKLQNAAGVPWDPEALIATLQTAYEYTVDVPLLRQLVYKAPECIDWTGDMGVKWSMDPLFGETALCWEGSTADGFYPLATKFVTDHMYEVGQSKGAEYIFNTTCEALVKDGDRIVGLKVTDLEDTTTYIHANKAVILCAGGFAVNRDMLKKYAPSAYEGAASAYIMPCDTGECTRMGLGVGADMVGFDSFTCFNGGLDDLAYGTGPFQHYLYSGDNQLSRQPWLLIDKMGKRYPYQDSDPESPDDIVGLVGQANIEMSRAGHRGYAIFDADYETNIFKLRQAACRRPITPDMAGVERMPEDVGPHDWRVGVQRALDRGAIKTSDTVEGLAAELELDPVVLEDAVDHWNEICASGVDPEYGYKPYWLNPVAKAPFYGIRIGGQLYSVKGGLRVNPQMQVINTEGKIIPGLYAGFHTAGGSTGEGVWDYSVLAENGLSGTGGFIAAQSAINEEV